MRNPPVKWATSRKLTTALNKAILLLLTASACLAFQGNPNEAQQRALKQISESKVDRYVLAKITRLPGSPELTAALKSAFQRQQEPRQKQYLAAALVAMGEPDVQFYAYLAQIAEIVVNEPEPSLIKYGPETSTRGQFSEEFLVWCASQLLDPLTEAGRQVQAGEDLTILADTRDPRVTSLLFRALYSRNEFVQNNAARHLALRRVNSAIPVIAETSRYLPPIAFEAIIANTLALFDNPEADREMHRLFTNAERVAGRKKLNAMYRKLYDQTDRARLGLSSPTTPATP